MIMCVLIQKLPFIHADLFCFMWCSRWTISSNAFVGKINHVEKNSSKETLLFSRHKYLNNADFDSVKYSKCCILYAWYWPEALQTTWTLCRLHCRAGTDKQSRQWCDGWCRTTHLLLCLSAANTTAPLYVTIHPKRPLSLCKLLLAITQYVDRTESAYHEYG